MASCFANYFALFKKRVGQSIILKLASYGTAFCNFEKNKDLQFGSRKKTMSYLLCTFRKGYRPNLSSFEHNGRACRIAVLKGH